MNRIVEYAIRWKHQGRRGRSSWSTMESLALWDAVDDLEKQLPSMLDAAEADLRTVKNNLACYSHTAYNERVEELEGRIAVLKRLKEAIDGR